MSRLLLYRPRKLVFKHFTELDLTKWRAKYKDEYKFYDKLAKYGNIKLLSIFAVTIDGIRTKLIYGRLAIHGWIIHLDKNLFEYPAKKYPSLQSIRACMFSHAFHGGQLDAIYKLKQYVHDVYAEMSAMNQTELRILTSIYKNTNITNQREIYGRLLLLVDNKN